MNNTASDPQQVTRAFYYHWWNLDSSANALGVTTSDYGKILLGG